MADFEKAYIHTMAIEGGYVNDKTDSGGETYKGVARNRNPNWKGWSEIDRIKRQYGASASIINSYAAKDVALQKEIKSFYKTNYWDVNKLDQVNSQIVAEEAFDTGVNMGVGYGARFIQEALNLCNKNQQSYLDVVVDGKIGPATLSTLNNKANERVIFNSMNMLQSERYLNIMRANKTQEKFWEGWLKRILLK